MKPNRKSRLFLASIILSLSPCAAFATELYWDIDGANAGAGGATPSGSWTASGNTWSTDSTGATATAALTTTGLDDLFFSAGTDATGSYAVTLTGSQNAKSITFEEGAATLSGGTLSLAGGGGITVLSGSGNPTISSGLTVSGNNIINVGAGRAISLNTGTFTRNAGATVNIQGAGTGSSTMTGLSTNTNDIIGPWASVTTSSTTTYAKFNGSDISGLGYSGGADGVVAAASTNVVTGTGNLNYTLGAQGTLGAGANVNTLRFSGIGAGDPPAVLSLTSNGTFTTKGFMYVGGGTVDIRGTWTSGSSDTEMVINAANGAIRVTGTTSLTGAITKTGSGTFTLGAGANNNFSGIGAITVNQGTFVTDAASDNTLVGATINSGGTLTWGRSNKHRDDAVFTINAGGTLNTGSATDTIGNVTGAGLWTATGGTKTLSAASGTFSGDITGSLTTLAINSSDTYTLSGNNTYSGATLVSAGTLFVTGALSNSAVSVGADGTVGGTGNLGSGLTIAAGGNLDLTGASLPVDANSTNILSLAGTLTLGGLAFTDLIGWDWTSAADGTYELIDGGFTVADWGTTARTEETAYDLGGDRRGYFTSGSLNAVIFTIPEPSTALLGALGLLALLRRRRN